MSCRVNMGKCYLISLVPFQIRLLDATPFMKIISSKSFNISNIFVLSLLLLLLARYSQLINYFMGHIVFSEVEPLADL